MIKTNLTPIICLLFLVSCTGNRESDNIPPPLFPRAKTIKANPTGGYQINTVTGDTIKAIILESGDTLITGTRIPTTPRSIHPDSIRQPKVISFNNNAKEGDKQLKKILTNKNVQEIAGNLTIIPINKDSLTVISLTSVSKEKNYLINSTGDSVLTGKPIKIIGKSVPCLQPNLIRASAPKFKDNIIQNIQSLDVDQGMSSSYIYSILQDSRENLWFGTYGGGVSLYDGEYFTHYTEKEGLSNNIVLSILEDKKGSFWFGTEGGGVTVYNGESFVHFTENEGLGSNIVSTIIEDKEGNIWLGTDEGAILYDGKYFTHYTKKEGLCDNEVSVIIEDRNGTIWFGTNEGITAFDGEKFTHYTEKEGLSNNYVKTMFEDKSGNLWIGTSGGGISKLSFNRQKDETFTTLTTKEGLSYNYIRSIFEDKNGNLWFGTYGNGVTMYNGKTLTHYGEKQGLNNTILSISEDKSGNLWFGTYGGGVNIFKQGSFTHYTEEEGLINNIIWSILEDKKGNLWFGTNGGGINIYDEISFSNLTTKEGLSDDLIYSIFEDDNGNIWTGTDGEGVSSFNGGSFTYFTKEQGLSNDFVRSILQDKNGNIWFGTYGGGVSVYDGEKFEYFTENEGLSNNTVWSMLEDKNGKLWFGTFGGGISVYDGQNFIHYTEKEGLSNNIVLSMLEDKDGNIWLGTYGGGVSVYDGENFTHYTEREGLSNNIVFSILEDHSGNIWISTENGINQLIKEDEDSNSSSQNAKKGTLHFNKIKTFFKNDGLNGVDFFLNSACLDNKNNFWWGSGKGLAMLNMDKYTTATQPPIIRLKQLDINEQLIDFRRVTNNLNDGLFFNETKKFENYPINLELPYYKNHLTFIFSAIDWNAPHKIQYSYLMEGLNNQWSQVSSEPKADYRNLPFGEYTFKVRAIGESGEWSESFSYSFTIFAPWWHTWWARTGYVLSTLLLFYLFFRWRTAKLKQRQKELETEVQIATQEIRLKQEETERQKIEIEKQKEQVEEAHKEITDSIAYAKRIQSAILPPLKIVKEYLKESFILYKPKDVVAGDFYWLEHKEDKILFAAADCTGHGVPGAMVSVICNNGLNRSVREHGLTDPGKILDRTREIVIQEFEKSEEEVKDGMDIALCSLTLDVEALKLNKITSNLKHQTTALLTYAGAHNPLWIIRKGEIIETKADKEPIGKFDKQTPYTTHTFELQKGDTIYIFSDGYVDQFGGDRGKKFKAKAFRNLLLSIQDKSMNEQHILIDQAFENWRGELEQIDDVCVIGVRV